MAEYRPQIPFNVPAFLIKPTYKTVKGVLKKVYPDTTPSEKDLFFCSFRTFGGTETVKNDVLSVENTAVIETWFSPNFTADCRVILAQNNVVYEIFGEPENINMRNQFVKFKVRRLTGGA